MEYFIDTHAHLVHNYDPAHLDQVAESGLVKQVWLLPLNLYAPEFEFAHDDEVLEVLEIAQVDMVIEVIDELENVVV